MTCVKGNKLFYVPVTGVALHPGTPPKMHVRGQENDILQSKLINTECASHGQIYDRISTVRIHATLHERTFNY